MGYWADCEKCYELQEMCLLCVAEGELEKAKYLLIEGYQEVQAAHRCLGMDPDWPDTLYPWANNAYDFAKDVLK